MNLPAFITQIPICSGTQETLRQLYKEEQIDKFLRGYIPPLTLREAALCKEIIRAYVAAHPKFPEQL